MVNEGFLHAGQSQRDVRSQQRELSLARRMCQLLRAGKDFEMDEEPANGRTWICGRAAGDHDATRQREREASRSCQKGFLVNCSCFMEFSATIAVFLSANLTTRIVHSQPFSQKRKRSGRQQHC